MALIDVILLLIVAGFGFFGFFFGFIHTLGNFVGTILAVLFAGRVSGYIAAVTGLSDSGGSQILLFIIAFLLISRFVGIVFWVIEKIGGVLAFVPFAGMVNRLLGAVLGLVEGIIIVGVVLFFAMQHLDNGYLIPILESSAMANWLIALVSALEVLFPKSLSIQE